MTDYIEVIRFQMDDLLQSGGLHRGWKQRPLYQLIWARVDNLPIESSEITLAQSGQCKQHCLQFISTSGSEDIGCGEAVLITERLHLGIGWLKGQKGEEKNIVKQ